MSKQEAEEFRNLLKTKSDELAKIQRYSGSLVTLFLQEGDLDDPEMWLIRVEYYIQIFQSFISDMNGTAKRIQAKADKENAISEGDPAAVFLIYPEQMSDAASVSLSLLTGIRDIIVNYMSLPDRGQYLSEVSALRELANKIRKENR